MVEVEVIRLRGLDVAKLLIEKVGTEWEDLCREVDLAYSRLQRALHGFK